MNRFWENQLQLQNTGAARVLQNHWYDEKKASIAAKTTKVIGLGDSKTLEKLGRKILREGQRQGKGQQASSAQDHNLYDEGR
ncbi:MAG: hypothetical protein AAGH43_01865 [Pseudomonadota bacterium]